MEINIRSMIRRRKFDLLAILICSALLSSAYAVTSLWNSPTSVTITTEVPYIQVVDAFDNNVTQIDFGKLVPGSSIIIPLIIKNISPNASVTISWSSTVSSASGNKIEDNWEIAPYVGWPRTIQPGSSLTTAGYRITVAADCPLQTFNWVLNIVSA